MSAAEPLAAIARVIDGGSDADDILRGVVVSLVETAGCAWAGILFNEEGELVLGPEAGSQLPSERLQLPVSFNGTRVAELIVDGCPDPVLAEGVATLISDYCLVGWDTGGVPWDALS